MTVRSRERDVEVTVTIRFPFAEVVRAYREALTPDGGVPAGVTLNGYLKCYAEGVADDMARTIPLAAATKRWRLVDV